MLKLSGRLISVLWPALGGLAWN